jgi:uncharacterized iron-regulated membrane protein
LASATRRALIQVHLWIGIGLGLYILMMSLTGSAIVARRELTRHWIPETVAANGHARLANDALRTIAQSLYPDHEISTFRVDTSPLRPNPFVRGAPQPLPASLARPVEVTFVRGAEKFTRRFDPFTGRDLGDLFPTQYRAFLWLVDLHNNLLGGRTGRLVNGVAAVATTVLLITGLIIWWPGRGRSWRSSLWVTRRAPWRTQLRQLHNTLAIWPFLLLFLWALGGIYFAYPEPFDAVKDLFFPPDSERGPTGDFLLGWLSTLHFGRFGGMGVRVTWIVLGLVPAALFVTGAMMWWHSVLQPALRKLQRRPARAQTGA